MIFYLYLLFYVFLFFSPAKTFSHYRLDVDYFTYLLKIPALEVGFILEKSTFHPI